MRHILERKNQKYSFKTGLIIVIASLVFFLVFFNLIPQINLQSRILIICIVILFHFLMAYLVFIGNRRFLKMIIFDFDKRNIETFSIIKSITNEVAFNNILEIKVIKSLGFGNTTKGFRNHNLVIRIKNKFQPQIFEIINISDLEKANMIIEKINTNT